jgi:hypothetical protein
MHSCYKHVCCVTVGGRTLTYQFVLLTVDVTLTWPSSVWSAGIPGERGVIKRRFIGSGANSALVPNVDHQFLVGVAARVT